ncbi:hypothetical protein REC12_21635 [Desulfosporosinus sp. PR]|uniref:hypothetical protein n=1 Tax=Candidatus Desulfosporosinus nitrosoreducens TaxID=3401928 RepID=UPI0027E8DC12|nr:hypothetical protein [Desulfosporosinus sp. PR]MDQ7096202.1 hypothetical protein [Desulfosporosinus sp. PR]
MSSINSTPSQKQPVQQAVIIAFSDLTRKKNRFQPCIFCGETIKVHKFKGKNVCTRCLHQIPAIFSFA